MKAREFKGMKFKGPFGPGGKESAFELKPVAAGLQACPTPVCSFRLTTFTTPTSMFDNIQNNTLKRLVAFFSVLVI